MTDYKSIKKYSLKVSDSIFPTCQITCSKDAQNYARQFFADDLEIYESFFLILMDRKRLVKGYVKISQGGIAGTVVDIKIVLKYVIDSLACSFIAVHNHPSGNPEPSTKDRDITRKFKELAKLIDSDFSDHIILTGDEYFSFADTGLM